MGKDCLPFPQPLPEFQRLFPDDAACATHLEKTPLEGRIRLPTIAASPARHSASRTAQASRIAFSGQEALYLSLLDLGLRRNSQRTSVGDNR